MFPSEYRTSSNFHNHSPQQVPRSAPHGGLFGSHIYSINESESSRKLKQHQKQLYFQELTRQVQEKQERRETAANVASSEPQRSTTTSNSSPWDVGNLPKYQKKYQIENHSTFYGNQVLGGALQRDETLLLKNKKEQQQREMQEYLRLQVEEKQKLKEIDRRMQIERDIADENKRRQQQEEDEPLKPPSPVSPSLCFSPPPSLPSVVGEIETDNKRDNERYNERDNERDNERYNERDNEREKEKEKEKLETLCQQLMEEQEKLKGMIRKQEEVIEDLKDTKPPVQSTSNKRRRTANNRTTLRIKQEAENTRIKHEAENAKMSAIDQKIENARRRRIENAQKKKEGFLRNNPDNKRSGEVIARTKSAQISNQWNLDTSAKSTFIYPNSDGMYLQEPPKETVPEFSATSSFAFTYADRKEGRPMIAKGFPAGVFRIP